MYLLKLSIDNGFTPRLFIEEEQEPQVSDETFFSIMKQRNPEMFKVMNEQINEEARLEEEFAMKKAETMIEGVDDDEGGFLNVQDEEQGVDSDDS
jgi:hypothetical protein